MNRPTPWRRASLSVALWLACAPGASAQLPQLVVSIKATATVGGVVAQDEDLLLCSLQSTGLGSTECTWRLFLDGSASGLVRQIETVDVLPNGKLVIRVVTDNPSPLIESTDLALFTPTDPAAVPYTTGQWTRYLDGDAVRGAEAARIYDAVDVLANGTCEDTTPISCDVLLSIANDQVTMGGVTVRREDIARCHPTAFAGDGAITQCQWSLFLDSSAINSGGAGSFTSQLFAFDLIAPDTLLFRIADQVGLPATYQATRDLLRYVGTFGTAPVGTVDLYFDGDGDAGLDGRTLHAVGTYPFEITVPLLGCEDVPDDHIVPAFVKRASFGASPDAGGAGFDRWKTQSEFFPVAGSTIDPDSEPVRLIFNQNGPPLYDVTLPPGSFLQRGTLATPRWTFRDREADVPGALGWRSAAISQRLGRVTGRVDGRGVPIGISTGAPIEVRQTLRIGDDCATGVVTCTPNATGTRLRCTPTPSTTTTTIAGATTTTTTGMGTTTTTIPGGGCCAFTKLAFTTGTPQIDVDPACGSVSPATCTLAGFGGSGAACTVNADCPSNPSGTETCMGDLDCGGLYFGGAGVGVPVPSTVPDTATSVTNITACNSGAGTFNLTAASLAQTGSILSCTSGTETNPLYPACAGGSRAGQPCRVTGECPSSTCTSSQIGCLFGPPLPVPNVNASGTSTCVINRIVASATGNGTCAGDAQISFNLASDLYLTGDSLLGVDGIQPCPLCVNDQCIGGPNDGDPCVPGDSASLGAEYPTSHDCPPAPAQWIGFLPIPFALTTGTVTRTSADTDGPGGQANVFCGFCRSTVAPGPFRNPPQACTSNAQCTTSPFRRCQQRTEGAFANGIASMITVTGAPPAESIEDGLPHDAKLVSIFCIPPSYNGIVDGAADLPGPGAVSLPGLAQLRP